MTRKIFSVAILSLLLFAFLGSTAFAAKEPPARRVVDPQIYKSLQYSLPYPDEHNNVHGVLRDQPTEQRLGSASPSESPGAVVGVTWYDYQHNGAMGRMIDVGQSVAGDNHWLVHFTWMILDAPIFESRGAEYDVYDLTGGAFGTEARPIGGGDQYAGYVAIQATNDNRAIVGAHNQQPQDELYDPTFTWDFGPANSFFGATDSVPRAVQEYAASAGQEVIWPKFRYVEGATDTVLHVIAQVSADDPGAPQSNYYFRRPGSDANPGAWDFPPYVVDTAFDLSHDIAANDAGKIALVWTANVPCDQVADDTASCNDGVPPVQWNNDMYYQISLDNGVSWEPRVNLTNNRVYEPGGAQEGEDHYKPYTDANALIDSNGDLHVVWNGAFWSEGSIFFRDRIFHWSENQPYVRTVHSADWDQTVCNGGAWNLNAAKMTISECNGKFYVLFVQFNDIPAGVEDDCADDGNPGFPSGGANGDLYVAISADGGLTWDQARNLTNSRTPGCDSVNGTGGPCESDHWPSMNRFGTNVALAPGDTITEVIVPEGGTDAGWYLDVQYINDPSAGGIVQDEGTWQEAEVKWFRLACVEPVTAARLLVSPTQIQFPAWIKHGDEYTRTLTLENLGNDNLTWNATLTETTGPVSGWLALDDVGGTIPFGVGNVATTILRLNAGGAVNDPGTIVQLTGDVTFASNDPNSPLVFPIDFIVADTVYPPEVDTISTACLSLAVLNNGSFGNQGPGKVNLDYYGEVAECDTTATVYLYDGSPVIGWIAPGDDTTMYWSVFGNTYIDTVGFVQVSNSANFSDGIHDVYNAVFLTNDSSIAIDKTWYAPEGDAANCDFMIQCLKVYSNDGAAHTGITFGEAIDWDVPADSGSDNGSGINAGAGMIWQYGGEYHQDDTGDSPACQDSDSRFAGMKFLAAYNKAGDYTALGDVPHNAYTADNATYVYGNDDGFVEGELYENMALGGFRTYSSTNPDSEFTDLHSMMTFVNGYDLNVGETLVVYLAVGTVQEGTQSDMLDVGDRANAWFCDPANGIIPPGQDCGCCDTAGDADNSGTLNVSDLTYLVNYLFKGGPAPSCKDEGDADGSGTLNVSDLTYLVNYLFKGGPAPVCGTTGS